MKVDLQGPSAGSRILSDQAPSPDIVRIGDGTDQLAIDGTGQALVSDTAVQTKLDAANTKLDTSNTALGAPADSAAASDAASGSIIAFLKRLASNITILTGRLPGSLGPQTASNSLCVTMASDAPLHYDLTGQTASWTQVPADGALSVDYLTKGSTSFMLHIDASSAGPVGSGISVKGSLDGSDWQALRLYKIKGSSTTVSTGNASALAWSGVDEIYQMNVGGFKYVRVESLALSSGTLIWSVWMNEGQGRIQEVFNGTAAQLLTSAWLNDGAGTSITVGQKASASSLPAVLSTEQEAILSAHSTSLSSIDTKLTSLNGYVDGLETLITATNTKLDTLNTAQARNTQGSYAQSTASTTPATLTAPANAQGFVLSADENNTTNLRFKMGAAASSSSGIQLQPGRDSGYIPCGADVSIASESGTPTYMIQWVVK